MATFIISTHGTPAWNAKTTIPAYMQVLFYQPFGQPMAMQTGFLMQSALTNPGHPNAPNVLQSNPAVALWNGPGTQTPEMYLTGDNQTFYTGIVRTIPTKAVIYPLSQHAMVTLSWALALIRKHTDDNIQQNQQVTVHCLFCL